MKRALDCPVHFDPDDKQQPERVIPVFSDRLDA